MFAHFCTYGVLENRLRNPLALLFFSEVMPQLLANEKVDQIGLTVQGLYGVLRTQDRCEAF
jgi:hypothetical protein